MSGITTIDRSLHGSPVGDRHRSVAGFSMVETLLAMAILLMICVAVLGLFVRSMSSNYAGRDFTRVTNHGRTEVELHVGAAFNSQRLLIDAGTEVASEARWVTSAPGAPDPGRWVRPTETALPAHWNRTSLVRQFNLRALLDSEPGQVTLDDPLEAETPPEFVHLKEITVEVQGLRESTALGPPKRLVLHTLRAY